MNGSEELRKALQIGHVGWIHKDSVEGVILEDSRVQTSQQSNGVKDRSGDFHGLGNEHMTIF